jgi:uncharacterized protein Yka (UPF0111/DUF47 family)
LCDNLRESPKESKLFEKYLKTLEDQEKEMDDLQAKLRRSLLSRFPIASLSPDGFVSRES